MPVEPDSLLYREGGGLPDIVQEGGERQHRAGFPQCVQDHAGMNENIAFRMKLRRLLDAAHGFHLRQDMPQEPALVQKIECTSRIGAGEDLQQFVTYPLPTDLQDAGGLLFYVLPGAGLDLGTQGAGESDGAEHAQLVLGEPRQRITDGSYYLPPDVGPAVNVVEHPIGL